MEMSISISIQYTYHKIVPSSPCKLERMYIPHWFWSKLTNHHSSSTSWGILSSQILWSRHIISVSTTLQSMPNLCDGISRCVLRRTASICLFCLGWGLGDMPKMVQQAETQVHHSSACLKAKFNLQNVVCIARNSIDQGPIASDNLKTNISWALRLPQTWNVAQKRMPHYAAIPPATAAKDMRAVAVGKVIRHVLSLRGCSLPSCVVPCRATPPWYFHPPCPKSPSMEHSPFSGSIFKTSASHESATICVA